MKEALSEYEKEIHSVLRRYVKPQYHQDWAQEIRIALIKKADWIKAATSPQARARLISKNTVFDLGRQLVSQAGNLTKYIDEKEKAINLENSLNCGFDIWTSLACLTNKEKQVVIGIFGLNGKQLTRKQLQKKLGCSANYVSILKSKALRKLKGKLNVYHH